MKKLLIGGMTLVAALLGSLFSFGSGTATASEYDVHEASSFCNRSAALNSGEVSVTFDAAPAARVTIVNRVDGVKTRVVRRVRDLGQAPLQGSADGTATYTFALRDFGPLNVGTIHRMSVQLSNDGVTFSDPVSCGAFRSERVEQAFDTSISPERHEASSFCNLEVGNRRVTATFDLAPGARILVNGDPVEGNDILGEGQLQANAAGEGFLTLDRSDFGALESGERHVIKVQLTNNNRNYSPAVLCDRLTSEEISEIFSPAVQPVIQAPVAPTPEPVVDQVAPANCRVVAAPQSRFVEILFDFTPYVKVSVDGVVVEANTIKDGHVANREGDGVVSLRAEDFGRNNFSAANIAIAGSSNAVDFSADTDCGSLTASELEAVFEAKPKPAPVEIEPTQASFCNVNLDQAGNLSFRFEYSPYAQIIHMGRVIDVFGTDSVYRIENGTGFRSTHEFEVSDYWMNNSDRQWFSVITSNDGINYSEKTSCGFLSTSSFS